MKVVVKGKAKEIAALAAELQERRWKDVKVDFNTSLKDLAETISGKPKGEGKDHESI